MSSKRVAPYPMRAKTTRAAAKMSSRVAEPRTERDGNAGFMACAPAGGENFPARELPVGRGRRTGRFCSSCTDATVGGALELCDEPGLEGAHGVGVILSRT